MKNSSELFTRPSEGIIILAMANIERKIKIYDPNYKEGLMLLKYIVRKGGYFYWRPSAERLYAYSDSQAAFLRVKREDVSWDILGEHDQIYKAVNKSATILAIHPNPEVWGKVEEDQKKYFSKGASADAKIRLNPEKLQLLPDAMNFFYDWRIGNGPLAYLKRIQTLNVLMLNETKTLVGELDKDGLKICAVYLKNTERKERSLDGVKTRIKERARQSYISLFGLEES